MQSIWCGWKYQDMLFVVIRLLPLYCSTCCLSESLSFFVSLPPSLSFALSLLCVCVCDTVGVFVRTHTMQHPGGCLRGWANSNETLIEWTALPAKLLDHFLWNIKSNINMKDRYDEFIGNVLRVVDLKRISHAWMSNVTHMNESRHMHRWVMSHI